MPSEDVVYILNSVLRVSLNGANIKFTVRGFIDFHAIVLKVMNCRALTKEIFFLFQLTLKDTCPKMRQIKSVVNTK